VKLRGERGGLIPLVYDVILRAWPKECIVPPPHPMNELDLRRVTKWRK